MFFVAPYVQERVEAPTAWSDAIAGLFRAVKTGNRLERRNAIALVESETLKLPQVDQPLKHRFVNGMYWREIHNPKGCIITTRIHREPNISVITKGRLACITEDGLEILEAPAMFETKPGTKRVLYAQEDVTFHTIHPNPLELRDIAALEARITAPDFDALDKEAV